MNVCRMRRPAIGAIGTWWVVNVVAPAKAFHYGCVAERDERKGLPYTAAMEWRQAAELFGPSTRAAEYSWRRWERIMHLPRRLAEPVGDHGPAAFSLPLRAASRPVMVRRSIKGRLQTQREGQRAINDLLISSTTIHEN